MRCCLKPRCPLTVRQRRTFQLAYAFFMLALLASLTCGILFLSDVHEKGRQPWRPFLCSVMLAAYAALLFCTDAGCTTSSTFRRRMPRGTCH